MVVEDDPVMARVIADALSDVGFWPSGCTGVADARRVLSAVKPAVVVLDLSLGDEFATTLLDELASSDDAPAVVICSAFPLANLVAARYGIRCVTKPFELDLLLDTVQLAAQEHSRPRRTGTG